MKKAAIILLITGLALLNVQIVSANEDNDLQLAKKIDNVVSQGPNKFNFQIDATTLDKWIKGNRKDFQVIDVRTGEGAKVKYDNAHIPGAIYIPYNELFKPGSLKKLDKNKTIIVVCHMGATEELVIVPLRMIGYKARALLLGMSSWQKDYPDQEFVNQQMKNANKGNFPTESSKSTANVNANEEKIKTKKTK